MSNGEFTNNEIVYNYGYSICDLFNRLSCANSSPIASQQFAGRGADDFNNELTQTLDRVLNGPQGGLNLEKLCIIPGAECWVINIDALVNQKFV